MATRKRADGKAADRRKTVKVSWDPKSAAEFPTLYSNHWVIGHVAGQVGYIYFGEVSALPIIKATDYPDELTVRPLAKVALSLPDLKRLANAISEHCEKMEATAAFAPEKDTQE